MTNDLSRRTAIAAVASVFVPASGVPRLPYDDDEHLLRLCQKVQACSDDLDILDRGPSHPYGSEASHAAEGRRRELVTEQYACVEQVASIRARTAQGVAAKARLVTMLLPIAVADMDMTMELEEVRLVMSLARDAAALC